VGRGGRGEVAASREKRGRHFPLSRGLACGIKHEAVRATRGNPKVARVRCRTCGVGDVGPRMVEGRDLIQRSLAIGSWVSETKMVFAANFDLWIMGE
jgi:hypothetical protein